MRFFLITATFVLLLSVSVYADEEETQDALFSSYPTPWFTGPLIATSAHVVKPGNFSVQTYYNAFVSTGIYDKHWHLQSRPNFYEESFRARCKFGLCSGLDFQFEPKLTFRQTQGVYSSNISDMPIGLNIKLFSLKTINSFLGLKLGLRAVAPIGQFQRLHCSKLKTDATGLGCWYPGCGFYFSVLHYIGNGHYFEFRYTTEYAFGTHLQIHGLSSYGGNHQTNAIVSPGNRFWTNASIEYNFTQNWAFACDLRYFKNFKRSYRGRYLDGLDQFSFDEFSLAPAIEYNFSKNTGLISGVWFSFAGKNASHFINGMVSLNSYF